MKFKLKEVLTVKLCKGVLEIGTNGDDRIFGDDLFDPADLSRVNDIIFGRGGDDFLSGILGNDFIKGGRGDDVIYGGQDDDILVGGKGRDTFGFVLSNNNVGSDVIRDFKMGKDLISFDIGHILRVDPTIFAGSSDPDSFELSDLDADSEWNITSNSKGHIVIDHPNGDITLKHVAYGEDRDTFAELESIFKITSSAMIQGATDGEDEITGDDRSNVLYGMDDADILLAGLGDDIVVGGEGDDFIAGEGGDDVVVGGTGADEFFFDPSNVGEGNDVIEDFEIGVDKIVMNLSDILDVTPGLLAASGDAGTLEGSDFDAVADWTLGASDDGDLVITHPNGSIELSGVAFSDSTDSFAELIDLGAIDVI